MNELEYLLTKCGLEWGYPNCPGKGKCSTCDNKKRIEYNLDKYKHKEVELVKHKINAILF